jgi:outer membrane biosynthesis protein TonB
MPLRLHALALVALIVACGERRSTEPAAAPSPAPAAPSGAALSPSGAPRSAPGGGVAPAAHAACDAPGSGPEPDARSLRRFLDGRRKAVRECYGRALKRDPDERGRVVLRFTIGTCGEVSGVEVVERRGKVARSAECVAATARRWRTPFRPAEPLPVEYPVAFTAE